MSFCALTKNPLYSIIAFMKKNFFIINTAIIVIFFVLLFFGIIFFTKILCSDLEFCLDSSFCKEGLKINTEYGKILINKENCIKYNWQWDAEHKWCDMNRHVK